MFVDELGEKDHSQMQWIENVLSQLNDQELDGSANQQSSLIQRMQSSTNQ